MKKKKEKLKEFVREIEIPEGIEAEVQFNEIVLKKDGKENKRKFSRVLIEKKENKIIVKTKRATRREGKQINTITSHIKNMIKGLEEKFIYKLQVCAVHFPMTISIKGNEVVAKNFLGETKERKAKILPESEVKIEKDIIIVESHNKEVAGQTASNIEKMTKIKDKDTNKFQDGIFMIEKDGKRI